MAIPTLSGSYIDETYIRLVQVSGSEFADGLGKAISFGPGTLSGGIDGYIPVWSGSTSLSNSFLNQSGAILKTTSGSNDIGLNLDFAQGTYLLGKGTSLGDGKIKGIASVIDSAGTHPLVYIGDRDSDNPGYLTYIELHDQNQIIKTSNSDIDIGLKLDFFNRRYTLGDPGAENDAHSIQVGDNGPYTGVLLSYFDSTTLLHVGNDLVRTAQEGTDIGLKLDFANDTYQIGNFNTGSLTIAGSEVQITGSLIALTITGSLEGTASWAYNVVNLPTIDTGSFLTNNQTGSMTVLSSSYSLTSSYIDPLFISASAAYYGFGSGSGGVNIDTSSFATTGSNQFNGDQTITGSVISNNVYTHMIYPTDGYDLFVEIPTSRSLDIYTIDNGGELVLNAQGTLIQTNATQHTWTFDKQGVLTAPGGIEAPSFTGSLEGTASWAYNVVNLPTIDTGAFVTNSQTSSFVRNSQTSSFVTNSQTSSFITYLQTGSFATTGSNNFNGSQTITGSLSQGLEGNIATGENSHAEGSITKAIGNYSHAEGDNTQAIGEYSHAEGQETTASGSYSHAEGYNTIALASHQHVQGQWNAISSVQSAFIVGNGTDNNNRSNLIHAAGNEVQITGSIIFNEGARITSTYYGNTYPGYIDIIAGAKDGFVELLSYDASSSFYIDDYGAYITTASGSLYNVWEFRNDGRLLAPKGIEAPSFTGSFSGSVVGYVANTETSSFVTNSQTGSFITYLQTGSFATTGSNTFIGNQTITGSIYLGSGSIISESGSNLVLTPPTAQPGQSLVIRPTSGNMVISASGFIVAGETLTITLTSSQFSAASQEDFYYTISGSTAHQLGLGNLSGTFLQANWVDTGDNAGYNQISIPIPANSDATTLTLTITGSSGYFGGYVFTNNPFTVTDNGIISSEVSHIHLVSGNPILVDLYLGDDDQYVKIEKNAGDVVIGTNLDTNRWIFDTSGSLNAPGNITATSFTGSLEGTASWAYNVVNATNSTPGGSYTQIQYNNGGVLDGVPGLTWESTQGLVNTKYYVMDFPLNSGGGFYGRGDGYTLFQMGFNAQAQFGGTANTLSGNQFFVWNGQDNGGTYYWGFNNTGDNYWGPSNSSYSVKVQQPKPGNVPVSILGRSNQTANLFQVNKSGAADGDIMMISASGNVGIGTTTPIYKLDVSGSVRIASEFTLDETLTKFAKYTNVGVGVANDVTLFSIATGSYTSAFGKYTIYSGSNSRAGELMTSRNGITINHTDVATNDIGTTSAVTLKSQVSQSYYQIIASFPATGTWDIKMMATYI
jgi:hypothetical protein